MSKTKNNKKPLLPFHIIKAAADGDVEAINKVLKHYEGYITVLSTKQLYDDYGNIHLIVDNEMRRTLETTLIKKILQFDITDIA